ncbi:hypothetical protein [Coraliomargarita akajimensis]|nr:hypothetical protein [Coraliomargarita akajimensis]
MHSVSEALDNPKTVIWSHSDRQADFYELPTDGGEMNQVLTWLLQYYTEIKLWMGVETEEGAELYLTCSPSQRQTIVANLRQYIDNDNMFEAVADAAPEKTSESTVA